jgi:excisionase family DNA binding protein
VEQDRAPRLPMPTADAGGSVLIDQAVLMLGVSRRTVYYWIRQGRLRTVRTRLGSQRVLLESIRRAISAPPSPPTLGAGVTGSLSS